MSEKVSKLILKWAEYLGIPLPVETWKISRWEVTGEDGTRGHSMVGVIQKDGRAIIIHTRELTQEDIIHELLHVAHPTWSESKVRKETGTLLARRDT